MDTPVESQPHVQDGNGGPGGFRKFLGLVLAALLILALPVALLAFDVWRVVFNAERVKALVTDEVVNSDLVPVALEWFSDRRAQQRVETGEALTGVDEPDIVLLMSFMNRNVWRDVKAELLTDEFLTHVTSVAVDGAYAWIDSDDRVPQIAWDLAPFIDRVDSDHGVTAIETAYDQLPECTEEQINDFLARLDAAPPGTAVLYNLCKFPDPWHDDQFSDYLNALFKVVDNVPTEFALTDELANVTDRGGVGPETIKQQLRLIRTLGRFAWLAPTVLVVLLAALLVRSRRTLGRWLGIPLLAGGFLAVLPALVYRPLITNVLGGGVLSETPDVIRVEAVRIILRLATEIFQPLLVQSIVIIVVAIALLIPGFTGKGSKTVEVAS
ncbi:MAG: hypothetical protein ACE5FI_14945 [Anaerolineales bacterium]